MGNKLLVQHILDTGGQAMSEKLLAACVVVTRHEEVAKISEEQGVPTVLHGLPGRNDTVRLGMEALEGMALDGCFFCSCDQPLLTMRSLKVMADAFCQEPTYIYRLGFGETVGSPVLFPSAFFDELKRLPEGKGGSVLLKKYPERVRVIQAQYAWELADADTPDQLAALEMVWKDCDEKVK